MGVGQGACKLLLQILVGSLAIFMPQNQNPFKEKPQTDINLLGF